MVKWISILLALLGTVLALATARTAYQEPSVTPLSRQPSINPYGRGVAALGKVESREREIMLAAPQPGLVTEVFAQVGREVKAGDALLQLDARVLQADLMRAQAAVEANKAEIDRWRALPRREDIPPLEAVVAQYKSLTADREEQLKLTMLARERGAANDRDVSRDRFTYEQAAASLTRAQADLDKALAGGWAPDLTLLEAQLARSNAELDAIRLLKDRQTVRAPRDGVILRRDIEPGEYASADPNRPMLVLGTPGALHIRAQVDEEDIALVQRMTRAAARTRGSVVEQFDLSLVRIEPYARPKTDLTGSNVERIDTRVVDVIFAVPSTPRFTLYAGQAVDVFIDVEPSSGG
ncbi:MAG TPA: HlyD family efflux transporter periplasmic adaptor subunit [Phycisphaerales bacterium]|nr:HlyD family efflux transporter periplasmic adaptor subunit [Phycisphaerales bacterium]